MLSDYVKGSISFSMNIWHGEHNVKLYDGHHLGTILEYKNIMAT